MQAIRTKYLGPTDTRGSRIRASCDAGSITIPYPHELSGQAVHRAAVDALLIKLDWASDQMHQDGPMLGGSFSKGGEYVFVFNNHLSRE